MRKKNKTGGWIVLSLILGAALLVVYASMAHGHNFTVKYEMHHDRPGYEAAPAIVSIQAAPFLKWSETALGMKLAGWICLGLLPVGCFLAWRWDYKLGTIGTPWGRIILIFGPVLLGAIFWTATYATQFTLRAYNATYEQYVREMEPSPELQKLIIEKGGAGNLEIRDENGKLTAWFKANRE